MTGEVMEIIVAKRCTKCKECKPMEAFSADPRLSDGTIALREKTEADVPALVALVSFGSLEAHPTVIDRLSFWSSLVLLGVGYLAGLFREWGLAPAEFLAGFDAATGRQAEAR